MSITHTDPVERIIADALDKASISYRRGEARGEADFILPGGINIECKRFYTERAIRQLADKPDCILIQGLGAALCFAALVGSQHAEA